MRIHAGSGPMWDRYLVMHSAYALSFCPQAVFAAMDRLAEEYVELRHGVRMRPPFWNARSYSNSHSVCWANWTEPAKPSLHLHLTENGWATWSLQAVLREDERLWPATRWRSAGFGLRALDAASLGMLTLPPRACTEITRTPSR